MAGRSTTHTTLVGRTSELDQLEDILAVVREGGGAALLIVGDPGIGKSALLQVVVERAPDFQVCRAAGVEGEVDLPYAGLHQLCRSMLDQLAALPEPQADALRVAFGLMSGKPCDRYLVGLAALTLMSEVASAEPLLCLVDDAQWVDAETLQALAFAARRLGQDSVGLLLAGRTRVDDLDLPTLELRSLAAVDAPYSRSPAAIRLLCWSCRTG